MSRRFRAHKGVETGSVCRDNVQRVQLQVLRLQGCGALPGCILSSHWLDLCIIMTLLFLHPQALKGDHNHSPRGRGRPSEYVQNLAFDSRSLRRKAGICGLSVGGFWGLSHRTREERRTKKNKKEQETPLNEPRRGAESRRPWRGTCNALTRELHRTRAVLRRLHPETLALCGVRRKRTPSFSPTLNTQTTTLGY